MLSPEEKLLTLCGLNLPGDGAQEELSRCLSADISWNAVLRWADRNEIVPLVNSALSRSGATIPKHVLDALRQKSAAIAGWNLTLASELISVHDLLQRNGIGVLPFKGPAFAVALYGQLGLRHCRDLDIFVESERVCEAMRVLERNGYVLADPVPSVSPRELLSLYKDVALKNAVSGVYVELHWAVCEPGFDQKLHAVVPRHETGRITVLGKDLPLPSPEDMLFLLSVHGIRHYWNSLKWICDIANLLRAYPALDWERTVAMADSFNRRRTLLLPLCLVRGLLGQTLLPEMERAVAEDGGSQLLARQIARELFAEDGRLSLPAVKSLFSSRAAAETDISLKAFRIRSKDLRRQRIRFFLETIRDFLKPDTDEKNPQPLLRKSKILYSVIQPIRLLRAYGFRFFLRTSRQLLSAVLR